MRRSTLCVCYACRANHRSTSCVLYRRISSSIEVTKDSHVMGTAVSPYVDTYRCRIPLEFRPVLQDLRCHMTKAPAVNDWGFVIAATAFLYSVL